MAGPDLPGCDEPPAIHFGGAQAFCGNDGCRVVTWDGSDDPAQFKAGVIDRGALTHWNGWDPMLLGRGPGIA